MDSIYRNMSKGLPRPKPRCALRPASPSMSTTGSTHSLAPGARSSHSHIPMKQRHTSTNRDQEKEDTIPFVQEDAFTDLILIVEGKRLHTSTTLLSMCSPVFARMLVTSPDGDQSGGKDGARKELQLAGKAYDSVHELLYVIHPAYQRKVSDQLAFVVLPLAEEYQIWNLKQKCEETLLNALNEEKVVREDILLRCLNMADEFKLYALWTKCLQICSKTSLSLNTLQKSQEYEHLSKFLKSMLEAFKGSGSGEAPPLPKSSVPVHQGYGAPMRRENSMSGSTLTVVDDRNKKAVTHIQTQTKY